MNFNVTFTEDTRQLPGRVQEVWLSANRRRRLGGMCASIFVLMLLQTKQELPSSLEAINEMNAWVKSL